MKNSFNILDNLDGRIISRKFTLFILGITICIINFFSNNSFSASDNSNSLPKEESSNRNSSGSNIYDDIRNRIKLIEEENVLYRGMGIRHFNDYIFGNIFNTSNGYVTNDDKNYIYRIEIPGYDKEEIKIKISGNYLIITAAHAQKENEDNKEGTKINFENKKSFSQMITLSDDIDKEKVSSNLKNGILTIIFEKLSVKKDNVKLVPIS